MPQIDSIFVTRLYRARLSEVSKAPDAAELEAACWSIAEDDEAGQAWCEQNGYPGYTSYASLDDLPWRFPVFKALVKTLDKHVAAFVKDLAFDLDGKKLRLDSLWINILPPGGVHTSHIHPHLSYDYSGSHVMVEPLPGTSFMTGSGGGRAVPLLVVMDRH